VQTSKSNSMNESSRSRVKYLCIYTTCVIV